MCGLRFQLYALLVVVQVVVQNTFVLFGPPKHLCQGRKKYSPRLWSPSFFLFPGLRLYGVYPSFRTYGVIFPGFPRKMVFTIAFFWLCDLGGDRPRKEGSLGGGVYSFSPCLPVSGRASPREGCPKECLTGCPSNHILPKVSSMFQAGMCSRSQPCICVCVLSLEASVQMHLGHPLAMTESMPLPTSG